MLRRCQIVLGYEPSRSLTFKREEREQDCVSHGLHWPAKLRVQIHERRAEANLGVALLAQPHLDLIRS